MNICKENILQLIKKNVKEQHESVKQIAETSLLLLDHMEKSIDAMLASEELSGIISGDDGERSGSYERLDDIFTRLADYSCCADSDKEAIMQLTTRAEELSKRYEALKMQYSVLIKMI